jgi:hypothetical protein
LREPVSTPDQVGGRLSLENALAGALVHFLLCLRQRHSIDGMVTLAGQHCDPITPFNESHLDQGSQIMLIDGPPLQPVAPDIPEYPAKGNHPIAV